MAEYDAIIIGSGLKGLSAAIALTAAYSDGTISLVYFRRPPPRCTCARGAGALLIARARAAWNWL